MNKTVLITGGTRGIGFGIARVMLREGWRVAINGTTADGCAQAAEQLAPLGQVFPAAFRVEDVAAWEDGLDRIEAALGPVDALVANAGILSLRDGRTTPLIESDPQDWSRTFAINVEGVANGFRTVAKRIVERGRQGAFVAVSSLAGRVGTPGGQADYFASKAAVIGLVRQQAMELGPRGIRVNVVTPGLIDTDLLRDIGGAPPPALARMALGRVGKAEEVGEVVEFLLSERASYLTGVTLDVTGGLNVT